MLILTYENVEVSLMLSDDGQGFEPSQTRDEGYGLQSMRERVEGLDGRLQVESAPGDGTKIVAKIPLGVKNP
jgi:signal transduction histidine kinase